MKLTLRLILPALLGLGLLAAGCAKTATPAGTASLAGKSALGSLVKADRADKGWLAKAVADYPLATCLVSGDKFGGSMGPALDYIWQQSGEPDRLVRFCCADCLPQFEKESAKFLKMIDAASAVKMKSP
jgi:hypothetical protein